MTTARPPLLDRDDYAELSVFRPEALLREARRQKAIVEKPVPRVLVLDPDGDLVDHVRDTRGATLSLNWACYHTRLWEFLIPGPDGATSAELKDALWDRFFTSAPQRRRRSLE